MTIALITIAVLLGLTVLLEVGLRVFFGFGNPLIYVADEQIGYLLAPNQRVKRFGNRIRINQYSMRSDDFAPTRSPDLLRVLLVGDSIANGAWWTDQKDVISELVKRQLSNSAFKQAEVLNASANSWSPRNELAYLRRFGTFEAQVIVLLINTDDLFGTTPTSVQVGRDRNYPDHKPPLALIEVFSRYLVKQQPIPELEKVMAEGGDRVGFNLEAIDQIQQVADRNNAKLLLVLTPLIREVGTPGSRDYEKKARQRLSDFAQQNGIPFIDFLPIFNETNQPASLYRDHIHLSPQGNELVSDRIVDEIERLMK